jgi:chaperonin GroES
MHVTPLHNRVLVRRLEEGEQTVGGIIIPDSAKEKPQQGQVIAVGKGRLNDKGQRIPVAVQAGNRILFDKYAQEVTLSGETYLILREEEVLAVLVGARTLAKTKATKTRAKTKPPAKHRQTMNKGKKKTKKR